MLDIGWSELLVVAVILIVVVGPRDLPPMLRAFGKMTSRLRRTAGEFRQQFDEALREAELDDVRKTISDVRSLNPANAVRDAVNPLRKMGEEIKADLKSATTVDAKPSVPAAPAPLPEMPSPLPPVDDAVLREAASVAPAAGADTTAAKAPATARKSAAGRTDGAVKSGEGPATPARKPVARAARAPKAAAAKATPAKTAAAATAPTRTASAKTAPEKAAAGTAAKVRKPATRKKDQA